MPQCRKGRAIQPFQPSILMAPRRIWACRQNGVREGLEVNFYDAAGLACTRLAQDDVCLALRFG